MAFSLLASLDAPTAGVFDFPSVSLATVRVLRIEFSGIRVTTDGTDIHLNFYVGGVLQTGANYRWVVRNISTSGSVDPDESGVLVTAILLTSNNSAWDVGNAATKSFGGHVVVGNPGSTTTYKLAGGQVQAIGPTGNAITGQVAGVMELTGAITGVRISGTSALTAGKVRLHTLAA